MALNKQSNGVWTRIRGLFQIQLSRLMSLVAIMAVLLAAWIYNRDHGSNERA